MRKNVNFYTKISNRQINLIFFFLMLNKKSKTNNRRYLKKLPLNIYVHNLNFLLVHNKTQNILTIFSY